jgi:uncharacterized protein (DUF2384 family)
MSPETRVASPAAAPERSPARRMFTPRAAKVPMPVEAATRQGRVAMLAWDALGDGAAARAFLNTHDEELGARPIDLAIGSAAGLETVEALMVARQENAR